MTPDEGGQSLLNSIGDLFLDLRQEAGLTQRQAAELAESTQARISYLEAGKADIHVLTLQRWAQVYGYELQISVIPIQDQAQQAFDEMLAGVMQELEEESDEAVHEEGDRAGC